MIVSHTCVLMSPKCHWMMGWHTWQVGQADDDDDIHEDNVEEVHSNAQPHPPILVFHIQASQNTSPQGQVLVWGIWVGLVLPVICNSSVTPRNKLVSSTWHVTKAHMNDYQVMLTRFCNSAVNLASSYMPGSKCNWADTVAHTDSTHEVQTGSDSGPMTDSDRHRQPCTDRDIVCSQADSDSDSHADRQQQLPHSVHCAQKYGKNCAKKA